MHFWLALFFIVFCVVLGTIIDSHQENPKSRPSRHQLRMQQEELRARAFDLSRARGRAFGSWLRRLLSCRGGSK